MLRYRDIHIDHKIAVVAGGPSSLENLHVTHRWCNIIKGSRSLIIDELVTLPVVARGPLVTSPVGELSATQKRVLTFVKKHILAQQRPPTLAETARRFGWSARGAAAYHLSSLCGHGLIANDPGRGVRVLGAKLRWDDEVAGEVLGVRWKPAARASCRANLTATQAETYAFLTSYIAKHGRSPRTPRIADALGIHDRAVDSRMETLRRKGLLAPNRTDVSREAAAVFAYIKSHVVEWQRPPSFREVANRFGYRSVNTVAGHLETLRQRGLVTFGRSRDVRVLGVKLRWEEDPL